MKKVGIILAALFLASCASTTENRSGVTVMNETAYEAVVDKWTDHVEDYNGFNNTVTIMATIVTPEVALAQVDQNARIFQWDQITYDNEKKKTETALTTKTDAFVSFYSPERKWDDLYKSKTLWKVFLDVNGQRYEGKAAKVKLLPREVQKMYHYHTVFATPYLISFPVAATSINGSPARLVFTGAVGSVNLNFGAAK